MSESASSGAAKRSQAAAPSSTPPDSGRWRVVFRDDFTGSQLDPTKWSTCYDWDCTNAGNPELEWYEAANVSVVNGAAYLTAKAQPAHGKPFTSGLIQSNGHFSFRYGYAEIRTWLPRGPSLWPAFWMLPTDHSHPPEIDVMENWGIDTFNILQTVQFGANEQENQTVTGPDFSAGFHTFGVDWEPHTISWYVDGALRWQVHVSISKPEYLLANMAVTSVYAAPNPAVGFPASMVIDYIEVWQHTGTTAGP